MVDSGLVRVDDEVEGWLRQRRGLPALQEGEGGRPEPVDPSLAARSRRPGAKPRGGDAHAQREDDPPGHDLRAAGRLPDRPLRRQLYDHEVRAAVDYAALEATFTSALDDVTALYEQRVIPAQIAEARAVIAYTKSGAKRSRVTQADMAKVRVTAMGFDELNEVLLSAAKSGAAEAVAELLEQATVVPVPKEEALAAKVADQARAVTDLAAEGMTLAVQRKAVQLAGGSLSAEDVADGVVDHLTGMKHAYTLDRLQGAVTMAQNVGRALVFEQIPAKAAASFYSSELLDAATCEACVAIDGTEYDSLDAALADYPTGGYANCLGGERCRGVVVAVMAGEQEMAA